MIDLRNLSSRDRWAVLGGLAALGVIFVVRWIAVPWISSWQEARAELAAAQTNLLQAQMHISHLLRQREELSKTFGNSINKPLENAEPATLKFNERVQNLLRESGIADPTVQPQSVKKLSKNSEVALVGLRVTGKCQLPQLATFLAGLRKSESLILVDQITATGNEKQPGQIELTLMLSTAALADRRQP